MAVIHLIPEGDLLLEGGNFKMVEGPEHVRQAILSRFRFYLGEWFLDLREGVPYYRDVLVKNPDLEVVQSVFKRVLLGTPGVQRIERFALAYDPDDRRISFDFSVQVDGGVVTVDPDDDAFIVRL